MVVDTQWANLVHQKSEAIKLLEQDYVQKIRTLEEQFYTQQKSHESREIELLKTIDSLKNEITSKESTMDDMQSNVDTLEGGVQVLNQEIAQQNEQLMRNRRDADQKIRLVPGTRILTNITRSPFCLSGYTLVAYPTLSYLFADSALITLTFALISLLLFLHK